jgi:D-3-phosphoglycerate dehydrogenase
MRLVVTSPSFSKNILLMQYVTSSLKNLSKVKYNSDGEKLNGDSLIEFVNGFEVAIVGLEKIDEKFLRSCPNLRVISKYGVGTDNIDFSMCRKYGVEVLVTAGVNKLSVAEHALTSLLYLSHNFSHSVRDLINGIWNKDGGKLLTGKTVGIVGLGNIGKQLVELLKPFRCNLIYTDLIRFQDFEKIECISFRKLNDLLCESDFISLHASLNETSRNMISFREFQIMRQGVCIVNTARSELIDQEALKAAIELPKKIGGIALDVFENEPNVSQFLLDNKNVLCTPHIAGNTVEAVISMGKASVDNIIKFVKL